jgi:tetratricopeptide (TPR) repeat protein
MFGFFQHEFCKGLERQDFVRFSQEFRQVIYDNIPTIEELCFTDPPASQPAIPSEDDIKRTDFRQGMEKAVGQGHPVLLGDILLLPFTADDSTVVAQVKGLDEYLIRKVGNDWLDGLSSLLLREFLLVKRACVDPLTGLLSSLHMEEYLDAENQNEYGVVLLVAVYPKSSSSFQAKKYQHRTVSLLTRFVEDRFPIYYLGQSCFGLVCKNCDPHFAAEFAPSLVNYLKRERAVRVHVSSVPFAPAISPADPFSPVSEVVMKKAWAALHVASKRGPFAFCNYSSIEDAENHPLAPPADALVRWFKRVSRTVKSCSLLQFDSENKLLALSVETLVGSDARTFVAENGFFLLLPEQDEKGALKTGKKILHHLSKKDKNGKAINCGISSFPSGDFRKSELLLNCRKALCHAAFLAPGSLVNFDAVSCNISGDIYYGDGDLVLAVKEYRRGLLLDPLDGNLLNSLGVCYAQMNRHKPAVQCFRKACSSKKDQFMALYNLGLEQQIQNENNQAIDSFSEALALPETEGEDKARKDMSFQLAVLCIEELQYQKGLDLLVPWYQAEKKHGTGDKAIRYLGEACYGLGKNRDAMKYLQQALRHDEYDAEVLGLLGEMYLKENEGDDIALRFCEKGVELNPDSLSLKLRLARAQIQCGDFQAALKNLQPCLRNRKIRPEALVQRGLLSREQGKMREAEKWFMKALACPGRKTDTGTKESARYYLKKMRK